MPDLIEIVTTIPLFAREEGGLGYIPDFLLSFNILVGWFAFMLLYGDVPIENDNLAGILLICSLVLPIVFGIYAPLALRRAVLIGVALTLMLMIVTHKRDDST